MKQSFETTNREADLELDAARSLCSVRPEDGEKSDG